MQGDVTQDVTWNRGPGTSGLVARRADFVLAAVLISVMLTGFAHSYLFRRDEPREAEIARETLVGGHWVTPHLCGLPFLEKPPLYYDLVAMPEFYKYSHLIVLDIAVGAFSTLAMAAFIWWLAWTSGEKLRTWLLCLFYAALAGAFLTKGLAGVFHAAITLAAVRYYHTDIGTPRDSSISCPVLRLSHSWQRGGSTSTFCLPVRCSGVT